MQDPGIQVVPGAEAAPWLGQVAALRIAVFRDWPYLYDGDLGYERDYLATYTASPRSVLVLALDGDRVVGASTALPLVDEGHTYREPFEVRGLDPGQVFYFGESVLLPAWRGRGVGHAFFDARETYARALGGFGWTAFAAVDRSDDDPRRPPDHRDNETFWRKRGYERQPGMTMRLDWNELGLGDCTHALTFWLRPLEPAE